MPSPSKSRENNNNIISSLLKQTILCTKKCSNRQLLCFSFIILSLYSIIVFQHYWIIGIICLIVSIHLYIFVTYILDKNRTPVPNDTDQFFNNTTSFQQSNIRRPILLCLGDSLTNGLISSNYTTILPMKLQQELKLDTINSLTPESSSLLVTTTNNDDTSNGTKQQTIKPNNQYAFYDPIWVINEGYNYATTGVLVQEKTNKALHVHPDYVLILIGTNDILGMYSQLSRQRIATYNSILECNNFTMDQFETNIRLLIRTVSQSSCKVEIAICTIPPIGEDLTSDVNKLVQDANTIIESIVAEFIDTEPISLFVLPLYEELASTITNHKQTTTTTTTTIPRISSIPFDYYFITYLYILTPFYIMFSKFGLSWNTLSRLVNHVVLVDGVHLNERGRDVLINLIIEWLKLRNINKTIIVKALG